MRIAIVEDEADEARELDALCRRVGASSGLPIATVAFSNAEEVLRALDRDALSLDELDLALLDCYLERELTGMDLARELRSRGYAGTLAFTTNSPDFAIEGYEVDAVAYLLKPVSAEALDRVLARAAQRSERKTEPQLPVELPLANGSHATRDAAQFLSAQSSGHYVTIALANGDSERFRLSFHQLASALEPYPQFISPSRGHLVNLDAVEQLDDTDFILSDGSHVPISRASRAMARERFSAWKFEQLRKTF